MKPLHAILSLVLLSMSASANPYFRPIDPNHPQVGAGFLISPKDPIKTMAVSDLALITHSTKDGTIIPDSWQGIIPPESWVPLQVGLGGSFSGSATIAPGASANLAPIIAANLLRGVDHSSSGAAQAVKTALVGSGQGYVRLGGALAGDIVNEGHFQSLKAAFPGRGVGEIFGNAARIDFGYSWLF